MLAHSSEESQRQLTGRFIGAIPSPVHVLQQWADSQIAPDSPIASFSTTQTQRGMDSRCKPSVRLRLPRRLGSKLLHSMLHDVDQWLQLNGTVKRLNVRSE